MKLLLDTNVLLRAAGNSSRLSPTAQAILDAPDTVAIFSVASLWEVTIKAQLGRDDFAVHPHRLRRELLDNGYLELAITADHVLAVGDLPPIHRDPFDRLLLAQAKCENLLSTEQPTISQPASLKVLYAVSKAVISVGQTKVKSSG